MFKFTCVSLLVLGLSNASVLNIPPKLTIEPLNPVKSELWSKWGPHIMDFVELIDIEKVLSVFMQYIDDREVTNFLGFIFGPKFKEIIWEFESIEEFKEAYAFLESKGYDVESLINLINSGMELPPFEKPRVATENTRGLYQFFEALFAAMPLDQMKEVFNQKLENNPEVKELFDTINSEEFMDILRRMSQNPKFKEIKNVFEEYGFDFKHLCALAKEIFGEYYQGIFCEHD